MTGFAVTVRSNVRAVVMDITAGAAECTPAVVRALNKTADQAKTRASREIRKAGYNLKAADVKAAINVKRASAGNLTASVVAKGRPIPLIKFEARATGQGVSVRVQKGRKLIAHAFIATMPNGHRGVFERVNKTHVKYKGQWRKDLPIKQLFGPGIPDALANEIVQGTLRQFIEERFPVLLEHEYAWLAGKLKR
jgi:hypothetical protein